MVEQNTQVDNQEAEYASFWRRAGAYFLDLIIFIPVVVLINLVCFNLVDANIGDGSWTVADIFYSERMGPVREYGSLFSSLVMAAFIVIVYSWFYSCSKWQATPGKRILKAYVVNKDNHSKLTIKQGVYRVSLVVILGLSMNIAQFFFQKNYLNPDINNESYAIEILDRYVPEFVAKLQAEGKNFTELSAYDSELMDIYKQEFYSLSDDDKVNLSTEIASLKEGVVSEKIEPLPVIIILFLAFLNICWYIVALFTKETTAVHDILAKTRVLKGRL